MSLAGGSVSEKKFPMYLTQKDFRERVINWSDDIIRSRIKDDGMPAIQQGNGRYVFPTQEVLDWFKRRSVRK